MEDRIKQVNWVNDWCWEKDISVVVCDEIGIKVPCALDKDYVQNDKTVFIKGFTRGSKRLEVSYGGLKKVLGLKCPIEEFSLDEILKEVLPKHWICHRCKGTNLNLRTDDGHKTYVCPNCYNKKTSELKAGTND